MSITTNILQKDAVTLIANGIKADLEKQIFTELMIYITPKLREIAINSANSVVKDATVQIEHDFSTGKVQVLVKFVEKQTS